MTLVWITPPILAAAMVGRGGLCDDALHFFGFVPLGESARRRSADVSGDLETVVGSIAARLRI